MEILLIQNLAFCVQPNYTTPNFGWILYLKNLAFLLSSLEICTCQATLFVHFCIANYLQKLQFKRNDRKDFAEVRKISGKLYGGYRHLFERSVPFRMVKWRNWSASLGAWLLISDFYFSMLTIATGSSLGTLTLSDLPFSFTLNTHTGKFNKLSKQQYSQVQGDLDT